MLDRPMTLHSLKKHTKFSSSFSQEHWVLKLPHPINLVYISHFFANIVFYALMEFLYGASLNSPTI